MAPPNGYNQNLSWKSEWENDSEGNSAMADVVNNTDFAIDVTYNAAEMAAVTYSSIYLTINFGSAGGTNTGFLTLDPTTNNPQGTYAGLPTIRATRTIPAVGMGPIIPARPLGP